MPFSSSNAPYPANEPLPSGNAFSVLVVEDEGSVRAALVAELRRAGVSDIFEAPEGLAALLRCSGADPKTVDRSRQAAGPGTLYAALDLGTNSCRMLIARAEGVSRGGSAKYRTPGTVFAEGAKPDQTQTAAFKKWSGLRTPRSSKKIWFNS